MVHANAQIQNILSKKSCEKTKQIRHQKTREEDQKELVQCCTLESLDVVVCSEVVTDNAGSQPSVGGRGLQVLHLPGRRRVPRVRRVNLHVLKLHRLET